MRRPTNSSRKAITWGRTGQVGFGLAEPRHDGLGPFVADPDGTLESVPHRLPFSPDGAEADEGVDPIRMTGGELVANRRTIRVSEERKPVDAEVIRNRYDIRHVGVDAMVLDPPRPAARAVSAVVHEHQAFAAEPSRVPGHAPHPQIPTGPRVEKERRPGALDLVVDGGVTVADGSHRVVPPETFGLMCV
jgi:hypothetical protein